MECLICNQKMYYFFSKNFNQYGLGEVDYWKCNHCGFCLSKTHLELCSEDWEKLNYQYHSDYQGTNFCPDDPKWLERLNAQVEVMSDLKSLNILPSNNNWLDYACGDGKLSDLLKTKFNITLKKYDKYLSGIGEYLTHNELTPKKYDFLITTSVFEHFLDRSSYNDVESLLSDTGILGLHTLVCEKIPNDPAWFYLLPVHTAFFTNKSMQILFEDWGFKSSLYNIESRLWFWFKRTPESIQDIINIANQRDNKPHYIYEEKFVDYWK
ncbi:methyltransferase domain-containing protein [Candidatus Venteria ishoeyi]|uniref:Methyltransferase domain protein n=1 Tax=Candidatus Venteria ishoeyi TaxID=1899563 RepID=A0A1H6FEP7_9GAMM|nr:methyltransferase domain-containing protein [Candidatus Venteria ishoeyi]SEH08548.1 Uncharacterised protein [Candidatus Venteria ishoeyi]